jgi:hypothetical protein
MNADNKSECCICLGEILNKNISITECNHSFHTSCLLKYNNKKCPICRQSLYEEDIKPIILVEQRTNEEFIQQPTLIDSYLAERNKIKKIMYKFIYIVSQIYVAIFLIFCLRIMCEILWLFIYECHIALAKYLF